MFVAHKLYPYFIYFAFAAFQIKKNGRYCTDRIFKCVCGIKGAMQFVPGGQIDIISQMAKVEAWRRTSDNPLPLPIVTQIHAVY